MTNESDLTFEKIFKQNERRIYYQIQKLGIYDPNNEFYMEGLYAMWMAYKKYQPYKGPLSTYFNYSIRYRLIDRLRKIAREQDKIDKYIQEVMTKENHDNLNTATDNLILEDATMTSEDLQKWEKVRSALTPKQWNWVYYHIILGMSLKEIAELKGVTIEAVKSWGKEARRKLKILIEANS